MYAEVMKSLNDSQLIDQMRFGFSEEVRAAAEAEYSQRAEAVTV